MIERGKAGKIVPYTIVCLGVAVMALPVWITVMASTHESHAFLRSPMPIWPGREALNNYVEVLTGGIRAAGGVPAWRVMLNSLVMALGVAFGKITISLLSAYAVVFFRFPLRMVFFWMIFITLMLPVEVRIVPTYQVIADLGLLNSYGGLIVPLIASATATLLFRQFFMTIPRELVEAARIDGAGPLRFLWDTVIPLSRTNIAAMFVIAFIYGWNQYLWPLLVTTDTRFYTVMMTLNNLIRVNDGSPLWHLITTLAVLAMIPPVLVVIIMQKQFVKGLVEAEK